MAMETGTCVFCGDEGPLSDEHVWPYWLGKAVLRDANLPMLRETTREWVREKPLHTKRLNITESIVCKGRCNNGWMQKLEDRVIPFLRPMAASRELTYLDKERRALLAAWCIKTSMVYEYRQPIEVPYFTAAERLDLMTYLRPPDGVHIWVGEWVGPSKVLGWPIYKTAAGTALAPTAYALLFVAGRFLMQILAVRDSQTRIEPAKMDGYDEARLTLLWPRSDDTTMDTWPPSKPVTDDEVGAIHDRFWPRVPLIQQATEADLETLRQQTSWVQPRT